MCVYTPSRWCRGGYWAPTPFHWGNVTCLTPEALVSVSSQSITSATVYQRDWGDNLIRAKSLSCWNYNTNTQDNCSTKEKNKPWFIITKPWFGSSACFLIPTKSWTQTLWFSLFITFPGAITSGERATGQETLIFCLDTILKHPVSSAVPGTHGLQKCFKWNSEWMT